MNRCCSLARRTAVALVAVLVAGVALSFGQAPEPAITTHATDPNIAWGPCPEILPAGCQIAQLHGYPSNPNADIFLKIPAKASFAKHLHTSAERMILLSGEIHVTFEGQKPAVVKAGSYMYGPALRPHSGACASAEPCLLFIAFEEPVDFKLVN
jgi:quercetin dioxygenase-like cupin family protein